ncbi:MAG: PBECR2 nuclease fold domain-containing protein, partial [Muribaculaceae bacterium]
MYKKKKGADSSDGLLPNATPSTSKAPSDNLSDLYASKGSEKGGEMQAPGAENAAYGELTALQRIPVGEDGEPMFEQAEKETAWDGLVEAVGSEADAAEIALAQVQQATAALEALKKKTPTPKSPKLKGSPLAMVEAKRQAAEQYQSDLTRYNQQLAEMQARLEAWNGIIGVYNSRSAERDRQQREEQRQRDAQAYEEAMARDAERKRRAAEEQQQRRGGEAVEQAADAVQRGAEPQQLSEPTEAQKAAGNYKKEHRRVDGYNISIENAKGSVRRGTGADGKPWETVMQNDYGYIRGTEGVDGDHIDVFLSDTPEQGDVFVVDQVREDGSFDEHKVMYGFPTEQAARDAYLSNYEPGWTGLGAITHVSKEEFKKWIQSSRRKTKPFAEYKSVKAIEGNGMIGRSLTEQEATELIARMEATAEVAPSIELTPENWIAQFGEDGTVETPIGIVKMGANQLLKLYSLKRTEYFSMIHPTLNTPDVIIEKNAPAEGAERDSKYLFVKTFIKPDGSRLVHFESVTVQRDGMEVSISSHEADGKAIKKEMQNGKILHLSESLSPSSERYLTEAPSESEGPDLVPTSDNNVKGKEREDGQSLILPSESSEEAGALSGPTFDSPSDGKGNTLSGEKQEDVTKSAENEAQETQPGAGDVDMLRRKWEAMK